MANESHAPKTAMIVARRIVRDIDRLSLQPGDKLPPERVMLEEYQVGRGTLRESLRFLELQGIISLKPGPGGGQSSSGRSHQPGDVAHVAAAIRQRRVPRGRGGARRAGTDDGEARGGEDDA